MGRKEPLLLFFLGRLTKNEKGSLTAVVAAGSGFQIDADLLPIETNKLFLQNGCASSFSFDLLKPFYHGLLRIWMYKLGQVLVNQLLGACRSQ